MPLRVINFQVAVFILITACSAPPEREEALIYDSAGVSITENIEPMWEAASGWTVANAPNVRIGTIDGLSEYQFSNIAGVWRRKDGRIVIGDRQARDIRIFASNGTFLASFGGAGEGPGEFGSLTELAPYRGDSIIAWDSGLNRLSIFDGHGRLGRLEQISRQILHVGQGERSFGIGESLWGAFGDGTLAFSPMKILRYGTHDSPLFRRPIIRLSPHADSLGELGAFVFTELRGTIDPFARSGLVAVSGDRVYVGTEDSYEVKVWSSGGRLESIVRLAGPPREVSDADREAFSNWYRDSRRVFNRPAEAIEEELAGTVFPRELPPYSTLIVDALNHLWVEQYRLETDPRPAVWDIFDPRGRWLGSVVLPPNFTVRQIGTDFILGIHHDAVPIIESYPLIRRVLHRDESR